MKRKVNLAGPTTLTVSLPSKWAKQHGIKKGDEIEVVEEGDKIIISTSPQSTKKETTIIIPKVEDYLARFLYSPYVKGYDVINIKYDDAKVYDKILETSKLLMGFEIIENNPKSCRLVNISTKLEQNFDVLLGRLFLSGITFGKELLSRLKSDDWKNLRGLHEYELNVNRVSLFCRRVIQTGSAGNVKYPLYSIYSIIGNLEEFVDPFRDIIEMIGEKKVKLSKKTTDILQDCILLQELNFKIFNQLSKGSDIASQLELFKEHKKVRNRIRHELGYFQNDAINSYICGKVAGSIEASHHISEELFY
jgi:phosphate uptake regulator